MIKYTKYLMAILIVGVTTTAMRAQSTLIGTIDGSAANDNLGYSLAMSKDGNRIAIGSPGYNVGGRGNPSGVNRGNVKIYDWNASNSTWDQVGDSIRGDAAGDQFGVSVDLSGSGDTLAVGAHYYDSIFEDVGLVRIYAWSGTTWTQLGSDIVGGRAEDYLGTSVALTPDGNRVVVGAIQTRDSAIRGGYVRTLDWDANTNTWIAQDTVKGLGNLRVHSVINTSTFFGRSVALSADGNRLIVGANSTEYDLRSQNIDHHYVYVYNWEGGQWALPPFERRARESGNNTGYGTSVDVSTDGNRWATSNPNYSQGADSYIDVFDRNEGNTGWERNASITGGGFLREYFGWDLQLSADGNLLVTGGPNIGGGINSGQSEDTYVHEWSSVNDAWIRTETLRGEGRNNREGMSVALSGDGSRLAIGAPWRDGNGNNAGRVRVFDNLNRLPFLQLSTTSLAPSTTANSLVADLTIIDPNLPNDDHTIAISGTDANQFSFNDDTTQLRTVDPFIIRSVNSTYSFTLTITDRAGASTTQSFVLTVEDVPAPPSDLQLSKDSIFERLPIGTTIGTLTTTDPNDPEGENDYTYAIEGTSPFFEIVGNELRSDTIFDFQTQNSYPLTITVTDPTELTYSETFTIRILSAAPTALQLSKDSIFERLPIGTTIGTLTTTDPNDPEGENDYTYAIEGTSPFFEIVGNELRSDTIFDFQTQNSYPLTITVTDPTELTYSETFTIRILSAAPTDIALSYTPILEGEPTTRIGTFTTTDPNDHSQNAYTYSLLPEARRDTFQIDGRILQNRIPLDYESDSTYEVTIRTTDPTGLTYSETFTINITNVEEDPFAPFAYDTTHRNDSINENYTGFIGSRSPLIFEQGTTMNDFTITDSLLVPVRFENFFTYRGDSLFLLDTLDHEISSHRNIDIQMRLRHKVNGDSILITVTTLRLRNVNEFPPTDLRWVGGDALNPHNRPSERLNDNTRVGYSIRSEQGSSREPIYLEVQDKDDYGPTAYSDTRHTFSIFSGNEDGFFKICKNNRNGVTRNEICVAQPLDITASNVQVFNLGLRATDRGGLKVDHTGNFRIRVSNVQGPPRDLMLTSDSIVENNPPNAVIGILSNTDNDPGDSHTYTITIGNVRVERDINRPEIDAGDTLLFKIAGDTLKVTRSLDYESGDPTSYQLTITARDRARNTGTGTFTIRVLDISPEVPTLFKLSPDSISENNPPNALVGRISHTGDPATYAITRNVMKDGENLFTIAGDSLKVTQSLDYENDPRSYTVTITATTTDANQNTGSEMLTLRLIDVPEITLSEQNIRTDNDTIPAHTLVSTITHPIQGDNLSLTLTGTDLLTLVGDSLRVAEDLDVSQGGKSFRITIRVVNNIDTLRTETFLITLAKNNYGNPHDSQTLLGESLNEQQGKAVALSANGRRMVIGTDLYDNSRGRVRVMEQNIATKAWTQMGDYLTGINSSDRFGGAVDINPEGNRIAIAADNAMVETNRPGVVYIYQWEGSQWTLLGDSLAGNANNGIFGSDIVLTNEGNLLIVGEPNNSTGRVHIYEWENNSTWTRRQMLSHSLASANQVPLSQFGFSVAASNNADRIVVGIPGAELGIPPTGITNPESFNSGLAFVYNRSGNTWNRHNQELTIGGENNLFNRSTNQGNQYGYGVAMSPDGARLAVGTPFRRHPNNNVRNNDGHIIIYEYSGSWNEIDTILGRNGGER